MTIQLSIDRVAFCTEIRVTDFPRLLKAHLVSDPTTPEVELLGRNLLANNFAKADIPKFVKAVCRWGGYAGIGGRVLKSNSPESILVALKNAACHLDCNPPAFAKALDEINKIKCLGTPSFASKHLRFLRPDLCPVFDSILREALPYSFNSKGYAAFSQDCTKIAAALTAQKIKNPRERPQDLWYAADVEAAIFVWVRGLADIGGQPIIPPDHAHKAAQGR
jgi:hypothetical protein